MEHSVLWTTEDYKKQILEYDTVADYHIQQQRGKDHKYLVPLIKPVLKKPTMVIQSTLSDDTYIYSGWDAGIKKYSEMWLHVVTNFQLGTGRITTAYFAESQKPGKIIYVNWTNRL